MHPATSLLVFGATALASAKGIIVPDHFRDGYYTFDISSSNVTKFEPISSIDVVDDVKAIKRGIFPSTRRVGCSGYYTPQNADEHAARQKLVNWCDGGGSIGWKSGNFAKIGNVIWYVCNYAGNGQNCNSQELNEAGDILFGQCYNQGGWVGIDEWAKMYGREATNVEICNKMTLNEV